MDATDVRKVCFKCKQEKPLSEFYKHKAMADGHLNKCKECTKNDVAIHRESNIEAIRQYDRDRAKLPHRVENNTKRTKEYRELNPEKYSAHGKVARAVRAGAIEVQPCAICGTFKRVEKHHPDYSKPLDVVFLCSVHHHAVHHKGLDISALAGGLCEA
jgi:hypothetical protein